MFSRRKNNVLSSGKGRQVEKNRSTIRLSKTRMVSAERRRITIKGAVMNEYIMYLSAANILAAIINLTVLWKAYKNSHRK